MVIAEMQAITYNELLPALLGPSALRPYRGYNPNVNPGIANEFSTAAFRLGHSMLGDDVEFLDNDGHARRATRSPLSDAFFNPARRPARPASTRSSSTSPPTRRRSSTSRSSTACATSSSARPAPAASTWRR